MELSKSDRPPILTDLPTEILSLILSNFCLHCREPDEVPIAYFPSRGQLMDGQSWYSLDVHALYSVCLVSRRLCDVAQAILYHEFVPGYGDSWLSRQYSWAGRLTGFLQTVTRRRDLAHLVRRLYLSQWLMDPDFFDNTELVEAVLEESSRVCGIDLPKFLELFHDTKYGLHHPNAVEVAAMLLSSLPNLSTLCLTSIALHYPIPVSALKAAGVQNLSLQTIDIEGGCPTSGGRLRGILELSQSTLRTLNINDYETFQKDELGLSSLFFPSLRNISVTWGTMVESDLQLLLSCCTGLETFVYDVVSYDGCWVEPSTIIEYLSRHQETLTTVRLDVRIGRIMGGQLFHAPMPSLGIFPVLQDVSLNLLFIYNNDMDESQDDGVLCRLLPPSIVSLRLYDTMGIPRHASLAKALLRLAGAILQGQFSRLKRVTCYSRELGDYGTVQRFLSTGVCLDMILDPPSEVMPEASA
ncbi:hypothetical protein F4808DRAFT_433167 [Astrocystis sublimbata]|nr:hypothetical protein F4808DRAFT_433167 [Astrocystis sublimbata]